MDTLSIIFLFFVALVLISVQYTLNKILVEIRKINKSLDYLKDKGDKSAREFTFK